MLSLSAFISRLRYNLTRKAENERQRKENALRSEYSRRIQLQEYQSHIYISVDGVPLIEASDLRPDIIEAVRKIRQTIVQFKLP